MLKPVASAYTHIAGYRQMGLKYDDLIVEEREDVQKVRVDLALEGPGGRDERWEMADRRSGRRVSGGSRVVLQPFRTRKGLERGGSQMWTIPIDH